MKLVQLSFLISRRNNTQEKPWLESTCQMLKKGKFECSVPALLTTDIE